MVALSLGIYNLIELSRSPADECTWRDTDWGVQIISVKDGGAAQRAGLQTDDIVLQIGGENTTTSQRAQAILIRQQIGSIVPYLILREGELQIINVEIVRQGLPLIYLIGSIVGLIFWIVGTLIVYMRPMELRARVLFGLFISFTVFWTMNRVAPVSIGLRRLLLFLNAVSFTTIPVFFLYFFLLYPKRHPFLAKSGWIRVALFTPTILILLWFFVAFVFEYPSPINFFVGMPLWSLYFFTGLIRLLTFPVKTLNVQERQQIRVLHLGLCIGLIPPILLNIPNILGTRFPPGSYSMLLLGLIPFVFAYTVVRHRLMDIEIILKKSFVYALLTGLVVGFYLVIVQLVGFFLQDLGGITGTLVLVLSTLFVAVVFAPVRSKLQNAVDRAFYRKSYDYRETIRQFGRKLNTLMQPDVLMSTVLSNLCESMYIQHACFFVQDETGSSYHPAMGYPALPEGSSGSIPAEDALCTMLQRRHAPVLIAEWEDPSHELELICRRIEGVVAVPLLFRNQLSGFIVLSAKRSEMHYSTEDLELLGTLGDQVAVALENGKLHCALAEQQRLKHELEIARRIQLSSLPQSCPSIPGFDIFGTSVPAYEVGGDYFDYVQIGAGRMGIVLGDVSGKGTSAALYMSKIQGFIRAILPSTDLLKDLLVKVNRLAFDNMEHMFFVTLVMAELRPNEKTLSFVRAGHTPILHYQYDKKQCIRWEPEGIALALDRNDKFEKSLEQKKIKAGPGDVFLLYSDGLIEAENEGGEEYGINRLETQFAEVAHMVAESIGLQILSGIRAFTGKGQQKDDMTLVVVRMDG